MRALRLSLALLLLAAPLLASAGRGGRAQDPLQHLGLQHSQIKADALSTFSGLALPTSLSLGEGECCQCARSVGEHVLSAAWKFVEEKCEAGQSCPFIKKRCDWIQEHEDEFTGYLVVTLKPMHDGYVYCMGNGTCEHPSMTPDVDVFGLTGDDALVSQLTAALPFLEKALAPPQKQQEAAPHSEIEHQEVPHFVPGLTEPDSKQPLLGEGGENLPPTVRLLGEGGEMHLFSNRHARRPLGHHDKGDEGSAQQKNDDDRSECGECLKDSVKWVLKHSEKALAKACEKTECPRFQKFCKWAEEHKDFVRGMIYGKVEPWKMAMGYCAGNGKCKKQDFNDKSANAVSPASPSPRAKLPTWAQKLSETAKQFAKEFDASLNKLKAKGSQKDVDMAVAVAAVEPVMTPAAMPVDAPMTLEARVEPEFVPETKEARKHGRFRHAMKQARRALKKLKNKKKD